MKDIILLGMLMGVGAAFAVGPVFVLIVQQAVTRGFAAGCRVILGSAAADLLLLVPAVAFVWLMRLIVNASLWVGLFGAAVFLYLGGDAFLQAAKMRRGTAPAADHAFAKGITINLANPLSWTFWLATGGPTMHRSYLAGGPIGVVLFTLIWFLTAMVLEMGLAYFAAFSGRIASPRALALFNSLAGVVFWGIAVWLVAANLV